MFTRYRPAVTTSRAGERHNDHRGSRSVATLRSSRSHVRCGAVCAIVGSAEAGFASLAEEQAAEERLIALALRGVVALAGIEA